MIDTDKYEGHTEGPWSIHSPVSQVTKKYRGDNEGKVGLAMSEWPSYGVAQVGPCSVRRYMSGSKSKETWHANIHLIADAPLLLAEVKRLREAMKTMLDDMNNASPEEDIEYWLDTWKHWLKEMIE